MSSTLISGHVARLDPIVPAHDALHIPPKAERQRPAWEDHRVALATSSSTGFRCQRSTAAITCLVPRTRTCLGDRAFGVAGAMERHNG